MRYVVMRMAGLVLAGGLVLAPGGARAYQFTGTFPAGNCAAMAQRTPAAALWYGHFWGQREAIFRDVIESRTVEGCFRTFAECDNWLYQWRSAWNFNFRRDFCVKGWTGQ
jgi:hypothetical protein